ncbi:MAG TPA: AMP-binding protein, partial [Baekduia sp.]|nr:AMP-binding protein [Baekduia sp.]
MNFAVEVVEAAEPDAPALVELDRAGGRREHPFAAVAQAARTMAAELHGHDVRRGDVVLTLAGNQPDWVVAMVACFRQGYVVLPCTEQLRAKDLRLRLDVTQPTAVVADRRNADVLAEAGWDGPTIWGPGIMDRPAPAPEDLPPAA